MLFPQLSVCNLARNRATIERQSDLATLWGLERCLQLDYSNPLHYLRAGLLIIDAF